MIVIINDSELNNFILIYAILEYVLIVWSEKRGFNTQLMVNA